MDRTTMLLLQALCAVALLSGCSAIRCYSCSSDQDPRCADPIDRTMLPTDCTVERAKAAGRQLANVLGPHAGLGVDTFGERYSQYGGGQSTMGCLKIDVFVTNALQRRQNTTIRGCALLPGPNLEEHCSRHVGNMQSAVVQATFCGACVAEGCNGATGLSLSVTLFALLPVALAVLLGRQ